MQLCDSYEHGNRMPGVTEPENWKLQSRAGRWSIDSIDGGGHSPVTVSLKAMRTAIRAGYNK
jgi:hypothetical protein